VFALAAGLCLSGCDGPFSILAPIGPAAARSTEIWWVMVAGAGLIFLAVMALVAVAFTRWRERLAFGPRLWLVAAGLIFPAVTLTTLFLYVAPEERQASEEGLQVEVMAWQWEWRFRYPGAGNVETVDVLHLPAGVPVELRIRSADVIHSFWVPRLAGKTDAMPGHVNVLRLVAPEPGEFRGQCSEFCGTGHSGMGLLVRVWPPSEYRARLAALPPLDGGRK
jgi:cytochrome c oxidase subunit II